MSGLVQRRCKAMRSTVFGLFYFLSPSIVLAAEQAALVELLKDLNVSGYSSISHPPAFNGLTTAGQKVSLASLSGKVVLLNFWATWCLECRAEMPAFERLHREFSARGLAVMGVNAREQTATIIQYANELGLTFALMLDRSGRINAAYGVIGLPTTFFIARNGRAVALAVGPRDWNGVPARALIQTLLAESGR